MLTAFQDRHQVADMVVVADTGMLSDKNLSAIDAARLRCIVGSKQTKAPRDLAAHFHHHPKTTPADGTTVDTITTRGRYQPDPDRITNPEEPVWDPAVDAKHWRAMWQYQAKRASRDVTTLQAQQQHAMKIVDGNQAVKPARFVKTQGATRVFDQAPFDRAAQIAGWKGYITNLDATVMEAAEAVASYHQLWHVEQSFRMSKTDLRARPKFHHTRDAIKAHLTVVFTALAVAMQTQTGLSLKRIIMMLKPLREFTGQRGDHEITVPPEIPTEAEQLLDQLNITT